METTDHIDTAFETGSLIDEDLYRNLHERLELVVRKLNSFIQSVTKEHISEK